MPSVAITAGNVLDALKAAAGPVVEEELLLVFESRPEPRHVLKMSRTLQGLKKKGRVTQRGRCIWALCHRDRDATRAARTFGAVGRAAPRP